MYTTLLSTCIFLTSLINTIPSDSLDVGTTSTGGINNISNVQFNPEFVFTDLHNKAEDINEFKTYSHDNHLTSEWFINPSVGVTAFIGSPLGCEDLFGRVTPVFSLSAGKWFNRSVGGRVTFQGFDFINGNINHNKYLGAFMDVLWNPSRQYSNNKVRWEFVPFIGTGLVSNFTANKNNFAIHYGLQNLIRINDLLSFTLEFGGFSSFSDFDGIGSNGTLKDNMFHITAGLTFRFKERKNSYVKHECYESDLYRKNIWLSKENEDKDRILAQLRKILEIKGLLPEIQACLTKNGVTLPNDSLNKAGYYYPSNSYSGLNSLLNRIRLDDNLRSENDFQNVSSAIDSIYSEPDTNDTVSVNSSLLNEMLEQRQQGNLSDRDSIRLPRNVYLMLKHKKCIGSPIMFFFKIGTTVLTDTSQLANLDELVKVVKQYNLKVHVTGFADKATGTVDINHTLSNNRAEYLVKELKQRGVSDQNIEITWKGGVELFTPEQVNRTAVVELYP